MEKSKKITKMIFEQRYMKIVLARCGPGTIKKHTDLGQVLCIQEIDITIEGTNQLDEFLIKYRPDVVVDFQLLKL
ncbi:dihydrodipicolinate reductase [Clostridium sp. DL-VIII]|uniref:dihydrodipicolinate reductase n=1 Tax=Clostridium sp. DL-VIII TaxID=641107 RepID=UPI00023B06F1|nr:dihydrodipicolinate reductase [Clostridium sp. DL-VIII]EHJ01004.1 dihydrodipicolinate reductase [Clostridium sp. DL-VIII]